MKILVRGTNWIGDAVMTIPAMRRLRDVFPDSEIALHTRSWAEGIFRDADFIDEIIPFDMNRSKLGTALEQAKVLRGGNFDLAVILPNSFESAFIPWLGRVPLRFGYNTDKRGIFLSHKFDVPIWKSERHEALYYLNLVDRIEENLLGTSAEPTQELTASLNVSDVRRADARRLLETTGIDGTKPTIAFGAGSTNSLAKRWGESNFAKLNDLFQANQKANVILLGSKAEADVSARVATLAEFKPFDLTGSTDLAQATALLSEVDLFISNDMGLAHIAAAVGTKTIVIFGPTNEITTRPLGEHVEIVRENVECSPCMLRECPIDHRCMTRISPERIFEKAVEMLERKSEI